MGGLGGCPQFVSSGHVSKECILSWTRTYTKGDNAGYFNVNRLLNLWWNSDVSGDMEKECYVVCVL